MKNVLVISLLTFVVILCSCENEDETTGIFTDRRDGHIYKWVGIGSQVWMAENLNFDTGSGSWVNDDNSANADIYGRLYDWETACDVCPDGWHLPTDDEWKTLEMYLGMSQADANSEGWWRGTDEGGKLKETGTIHWNCPNIRSTNESGFSALPGGAYNMRYCDGKGYGGSFWSSTESDSSNAWCRELFYNKSEVNRSYYGYKGHGFSVRCIRD